MQFILENYLLIVLVGLFFVFALIGYLIEMLRGSSNTNNKVSTNNNDIKSIEIAKLDDLKEDNTKDKSINKSEELDDLLKSYDNDKNEVITEKNM